MYTIVILFVCDWHQRLLFLGNPSETPWKPLGNPLETLRKPLGNPLVHNAMKRRNSSESFPTQRASHIKVLEFYRHCPRGPGP